MGRDESIGIRVFHVWMLLRMWIQEKLAAILIFCYLIPHTNQATSKISPDN